MSGRSVEQTVYVKYLGQIYSNLNWKKHTHEIGKKTKNSLDCQIVLGLRPRPILAVLRIFFIQLFPNWTACSPNTYTNLLKTGSLHNANQEFLLA